jgi:hypothetical protein
MPKLLVFPPCNLPVGIMGKIKNKIGLLLKTKEKNRF